MNIGELKNLAEPTLEQVAIIILDDIKQKYHISSAKELDELTLNHYKKHGRKNFDTSIENREIFLSPDEVRLEDYRNGSNANKQYKFEKGQHLDACCELLDIKKEPNNGFDVNFIQLWENEVKDSNWYMLIIRNWSIMKRLYGITPNKDFAENPLPFLKTFCDEVFGISCLVRADTSDIKARDEARDKLIKEHKKNDIYR